jgi:hypothetical protein
MTGPPALRPDYETAPPVKRANPDGIPVRLYDGALVAHVNRERANELLENGVAEAFRRGPRQYLRLRQGIDIPQTGRGWDFIEALRRWHGDEKAAGYIAHKDRQSERLRYRPALRRPSSS